MAGKIIKYYRRKHFQRVYKSLHSNLCDVDNLLVLKVL